MSKAVAAVKTLLSEYVDRHYIVTKTVEVPKEFRHVVIGSHGDRVANIKKMYNVRIIVPLQNDPEGSVRVKGLL